MHRYKRHKPTNLHQGKQTRFYWLHLLIGGYKWIKLLLNMMMAHTPANGNVRVICTLKPGQLMAGMTSNVNAVVGSIVSANN